MTRVQKLQAAIDCRRREQNELSDEKFVLSRRIYFANQHAWMANWPATEGGNERKLAESSAVTVASLELAEGKSISEIVESASKIYNTIPMASRSETRKSLAWERLQSMSTEEIFEAFKHLGAKKIQEILDGERVIVPSMVNRLLADV